MNAWSLRRLTPLLFAAALGGCSKSSPTDGIPDCTQMRACGSNTPAPATEVPPIHRPTAQACVVTPTDAMPGWYTATGTPCTSDAQCKDDGGLPGHCLHGTCAADECLTDDDCAGGGVCLCAAPVENSAIWNRNTCVHANCRVDGDCGAGGYCVPSAGVCGVNGYYCHTAADTCVDPTKDCDSSCASACSYFPDKGSFACMGFVCGGC